MLDKHSRPLIGRLSELLVSVNQVRFLASITSPRSPLDFETPPPSPPLSPDSPGVGLGIAACLHLHHRADESCHEILPKHKVCNRNVNRSSRRQDDPGQTENGSGDVEDMDTESYTYVTSRRTEKCLTTVYHDGGKCRGAESGLRDRPVEGPLYGGACFPISGFLQSCFLCGKALHGKDIFMYRGEKAFCSVECRSRQIMMDECKELCRSEVLLRSRNRHAASSCAPAPIFFAAETLTI